MACPVSNYVVSSVFLFIIPLFLFFYQTPRLGILAGQGVDPPEGQCHENRSKKKEEKKKASHTRPFRTRYQVPRGHRRGNCYVGSRTSVFVPSGIQIIRPSRGRGHFPVRLCANCPSPSSHTRPDTQFSRASKPDHGASFPVMYILECFPSFSAYPAAQSVINSSCKDNEPVHLPFPTINASLSVQPFFLPKRKHGLSEASVFG